MINRNDNVALITGASRGIGAATARLLAERGAGIVINYRSKGPRAEQVAEDIRARGRRALLAQADLTDEAEVQAMMAAFLDKFGHIDLLILNASSGMEKDSEDDYRFSLI